MHTHFALNYHFCLLHTNLSLHCDVSALCNYYHFVGIQIVLLLFPFRFAFAWQQKRWNGVVNKRDIVLAVCRCCCCFYYYYCWPLTTLNILRIFAAVTAVCLCDEITVRNVAPAWSHVAGATVSQSIWRNAETQLSIDINCVRDTNRSTKVLRTSFVRVYSS